MPWPAVPLNDGRSMPSIAYGTGSVWKGQDPTAYIVQAIRAGFNHIDTAQAYRTEDAVGRALKETAIDRQKVFITTKYWDANIDVTTPGLALQESLRQMGLFYVDLYLIHNPRRLIDRIESVWGEFESLLSEGLAKSIGVSNFTKSDLEALMKHAKVTPSVNQISFNPYKLAETEDLVQYCRQHGVLVEAYSPLAPLTKQPGGPVDAVLESVSERLSVTPGQVLLSWIRSKGIAVVTTSSKAERLTEYLEAGDIHLTDGDVAAIDKAGREGPPLRINGGFLRRSSTLTRVSACLMTSVLYVCLRRWLR